MTSPDARDLTLSEAQEAVHAERFYEHPVDSFYAGVRHAEAVIRKMREGEPHALAIEHADLRREMVALREALDYLWGVLPSDEVVALPDEIRETCRANHLAWAHHG